MKLIYTDSVHNEKTFEGPFLKEGAEGALTITIAPNDVQWQNSTIIH